MTTVAEILVQLKRRCLEKGDAIALQETTGRQLTFRALWDQVENVSNNLSARGLQPGDNVLFAVRPRIESIVLILAIVRAGGVVVALDVGMGEELFASRIGMIKPKWMMAESSVLALSSTARARALLRWRGVTLPKLAAIEGCKFVRVGPFLPIGPRALPYQALCKPAARNAPPAVPPDAPAFVVFTSGTTESPKAVVHTGSSIGATLAIAAEHLAIGAADVVYAAELHLVVPALLAGVRIVLPRYGRFEPGRYLHDLERHRISHTYCLPADIQTLIRYCTVHGERLPRALKIVMLGAAPIYPVLLGRLRGLLEASTHVSCIYAMTEMLPVCAVTLDEKLAYGGGGDLVGRPFPGISVRLEQGELIIGGPNLFSHYLGEAPIEEHATGDLARVDDDGRVVLLGRKKDMIIRGHYNIYPPLFEPTIEKIAGVRRCALVGVYIDGSADETVILAIEPEGRANGEFEVRVRRALRAGPFSIDASAQPDRIVVMQIPLAGRSQKVDVDALRAAIRERL